MNYNCGHALTFGQTFLPTATETHWQRTRLSCMSLTSWEMFFAGPTYRLRVIIAYTIHPTEEEAVQ